MTKTIQLALALSMLLGACEQKNTAHSKGGEYTDNNEVIDTQTYADISTARISHLNWDVEVDFDHKIIKGSATYDFVNKQADHISFDTEQLTIDSVFVGNNKHSDYHLGNNDPVKGRELRIQVTPADTQVTIYYKTSPEANALQWLDPVQTHDKKYPFLLTQGEAILTRSYIPIQDTPSIRITYNAQVKVPKELMPVMSAINPKENNGEGIYTFEMPQALPPYLIALAVGDLAYKAIDHRTGVYAEKGQLATAAWELVDMGKMVSIAEELYGEYPWEQFDVLILPSSFPFGGMENPRLTFATPTIIVGDRSLTNLVAHELAHSWSGNLVTNATWNDFWLNEGFTVYFERRIMEAMEGKDYSDMLSVIGYQELETSMQLLPKAFTSLYIDFKGINPDDGFSNVPYDKGYLFLKSLENKYGREKFDVFLKGYFTSYQFQTITTEQFIAYLKDNLTAGDDSFVQEWIYDTGWPVNIVKPTSKFLESVNTQFTKDLSLVRGNTKVGSVSRDWSTNEWVHYIRQIDVEHTTAFQMQKLDQMHNFTNSHNPEILCAWYEKAFLTKYSQVNEKAEDFLVHIGRCKFLEPLYYALKNSEQIDLAKKIYTKSKPNYHFVAKEMVESILELK